MNSLFPSIVSRSQSSGLMNFFVPIISIVLTLITGSIIFVLLGFDPVYALYTFFISPISSTYGISELFVKATPLALIAIGLSYCCLLYTSPSPRDRTRSRMPSSA